MTNYIAFRAMLREIDGDNCVEWTNSLVKGYGQIRKGDFKITVHREAYALTYGAIPEGLCVMHTCDNTKCINPRHLKLGTSGENNTDRAKKGRNRDNTGEEHPMSVLTEVDVIEIRSSSLSRKELANLFSVSENNIGQIIRRERWKNI
jgi:hypothetical protein